MKRAERHHLKQNELQHFALQARDVFEQRKRETTILVAVVAVAIVVAAGYLLYRERVQSRAHALLADAMSAQESRVATPTQPGPYPTERARLEAAAAKFKTAADAYPSTDSGIFARYQEAGAQVAMGNPAAAVTAYQDVIQRAGTSSIYGEMARLGMAEAQARAGQYEQAINTFKELAQRKDGPLPIDGILMQLGRTYRDAGKGPDAKQTFNRLVTEFPDSPFTQEAKRELDTLNKT